MSCHSVVEPRLPLLYYWYCLYVTESKSGSICPVPHYWPQWMCMWHEVCNSEIHWRTMHNYWSINCRTFRPEGLCQLPTKTFGLKCSAVDWLIVVYCLSVNFVTISTQQYGPLQHHEVCKPAHSCSVVTGHRPHVRPPPYSTVFTDAPWDILLQVAPLKSLPQLQVWSIYYLCIVHDSCMYIG